MFLRIKIQKQKPIQYFNDELFKTKHEQHAKMGVEIRFKYGLKLNKCWVEMGEFVKNVLLYANSLFQLENQRLCFSH